MSETSTPVSSTEPEAARMSGWAVVRRGFAMTPALTRGLWITIALSIFSTAGGALVPVVVQRAIDSGLHSGTGEAAVDLDQITASVALVAGILVLVLVTGYLAKLRIFTATELGLADLRVMAFRHVHDLSMLTQNTQRRGALVSRVTSDIDQISQFIGFTGMLMIISVGQMLVATIVMLVLSWQLALVVLVSFLPLWLSLKFFARAMANAYDRVRASVGDMLAVIAEPVVGASVVRAYAAEDRTQERIDAAVGDNYRLNVRAQAITSVTFGSAVLVGGVANAGVLVFGVLIGTHAGWWGGLSMGTVVAFIFLVGQFTNPAQMATQVIADAQNAISSWRRVIELLDTPADVVDPGTAGVRLPAGDLPIRFEHVDFAYPGSDSEPGALVLHDVHVSIAPRQRVAVVGETGSGKTTFAKLLTRLMDPSAGRVLVGGVPLAEVAFEQLREHVLMVPQEGFLFDASVARNLRYGRPRATDGELVAAFEDLGLADWFAGLPAGLDTQVGQRGENLSAGERQLVALVRSALADPEILVLDEATSAVDPQTELRATRALDRLLDGRTSVTIAHRLSTAENADRILVFDAGVLVEDGPHGDLVRRGGVYSRLHASWVAQSGAAAGATTAGDTSGPSGRLVP